MRGEGDAAPVEEEYRHEEKREKTTMDSEKPEPKFSVARLSKASTIITRWDQPSQPSLCYLVSVLRETLCRLQDVFNVFNRLARIGSV